MTTGWKCSRCGTMYGVLTTMPRPPKTIEESVVRNMTQKTHLSGYQDLRRVLFARCYARKCPLTLRALLWRILYWKERRLLVSDDAYMDRWEKTGLDARETIPEKEPK